MVDGSSTKLFSISFDMVFGLSLILIELEYIVSLSCTFVTFFDFDCPLLSVVCVLVLLNRRLALWEHRHCVIKFKLIISNTTELSQSIFGESFRRTRCESRICTQAKSSHKSSTICVHIDAFVAELHTVPSLEQCPKIFLPFDRCNLQNTENYFIAEDSNHN